MILIIVIVFALFIIALLLILSIFLWRYLQQGKEAAAGEDENILDTLEKSLSAGDIDKKEYDRMRRLIGSSPPAGHREVDK